MRPRASLALLMGFVAIIAVGLAAMKVATEGLARGVLLSAFAGLLVATVGSLVRPRHRAAWIGAAVFGWGYLLLVVASAFMHVLSGSHGDSSYDWRIDDLSIVIAERVHPGVPYPVDPFPGASTTFDPATGRRTKIINQVIIPFTPTDLKLQAEYDAQLAFHKDQASSTAGAWLIGLTVQGMAFALIGGAVGHALSGRSVNSDASPTLG